MDIKNNESNSSDSELFKFDEVRLLSFDFDEDIEKSRIMVTVLLDGVVLAITLFGWDLFAVSDSEGELGVRWEDSVICNVGKEYIVGRIEDVPGVVEKLQPFFVSFVTRALEAAKEAEEVPGQTIALNSTEIIV